MCVEESDHQFLFPWDDPQWQAVPHRGKTRYK